MADARWDRLIRGATVYDGSGGAPFRADVALRGERIAAVGELEGRAGSTLDATGLALAPGFIDVHSHDDFAVRLDPEMDFKVMQGVTTDVVGNCGMGAAPFEAASLFCQVTHPGASLAAWSGYAGYLEAVEAEPPSLNVAVLVGHGTLRIAAMGNAARDPDAQELERMRRDLREGLEAGAVGLSTGLIYDPARHAKTDEIVALAQELEGSGGLYATHMRNEAEALLDAVRETLEIGERAGVPVQISHHKASGPANRGRVRDSLRLIEEARARGLDVTADQYPYTAGSTILAAVVPAPGSAPASENDLGPELADAIVISSAPGRTEWEGQSLQDLARAWDLDPFVAAARVLQEEPRAVAVLHTMHEEDVRTVLCHPTTMIGSDGIPTAGGKPHPRLYGTFPRVLGRYARDEGLLPLAEAIHRMTGLPAGKFRLEGRGRVREGAFADLVLFDAERILDTATYTDPRRYPDGIRHVFVNGTAVVRDGAHTHARPGQALRLR
jgi:N-acyl-D-amino-acid deacylase